jgi:hypothetical protein
MAEEGKSKVFEILFTPVSFYNGERFLSNQRRAMILSYSNENAVKTIKSSYPKNGVIINEVIVRMDCDVISNDVVDMICRKSMKRYIQENNLKSGDFGLPYDNRPAWMNSSSI